MFRIFSQTRNIFPLPAFRSEHRSGFLNQGRTGVLISKLDKHLPKSLPRSRDRRSQGAMLGQGLIIVPKGTTPQKKRKTPQWHTIWTFKTPVTGSSIHHIRALVAIVINGLLAPREPEPAGNILQNQSRNHGSDHSKSL